MEFGLSLSGLQRDRQGKDLSARFDEILRYVHTARDLGYDYISFGQHYLTAPYQMMQPVSLISRLIPETGDMRMLATVIAPLQNPVQLAEEFATLDVLSKGRVTLTLALGYREEEYRAFGVDPKRRVSRMVDVVTAVRQLWTDGKVSLSSQHFDLDDVHASVLPVQRPHPPLWIAANADPAIERAARWGLPWRINSHATFEEISRQVALYRAAYQPRADASSVLLPFGRELFCAQTRALAMERSRPFLQENYTRYANWGQDKALPGEVDFTMPYEDLLDDRFIVGDPEDCRAAISRYESLGIGFATFRMSWPGMPPEQSLESMELFARDVIPHFRPARDGGS